MKDGVRRSSKDGLRLKHLIYLKFLIWYCHRHPWILAFTLACWGFVGWLIWYAFTHR